jgi:hypothetical protein
VLHHCRDHCAKTVDSSSLLNGLVPRTLRRHARQSDLDWRQRQTRAEALARVTRSSEFLCAPPTSARLCVESFCGEILSLTEATQEVRAQGDRVAEISARLSNDDDASSDLVDAFRGELA